MEGGPRRYELTTRSEVPRSRVVDDTCGGKRGGEKGSGPSGLLHELVTVHSIHIGLAAVNAGSLQDEFHVYSHICSSTAAPQLHPNGNSG